MELEYIVVYKNSSDEFDIARRGQGLCWSSEVFPIYHNTNCQVLYPNFLPFIFPAILLDMGGMLLAIKCRYSNLSQIFHISFNSLKKKPFQCR